MESPLLTWVVITFVVLFCFCQQNVGGQPLPLVPNHPDNTDGNIVPTPPPPPPLPPSRPPSPPPPPPSSPPPSPHRPSPPPTPPPSYLPPPARPTHSSHHLPPPPRKGLPLAPPPKNIASARNHNNDHNPTSAPGKLSPPATKEKRLNFGKKIGLLFVGIAAILQVCVVAFLMIKRRQLLRAESRF